MTTLAQLAARAAGALDDAAYAHWSQARLEEWCIEGLREYSQTHPRTLTTTISCVAGQRDYDLPADVLDVVTVEYPAGEFPRRLLRQAFALDDAFDAAPDAFFVQWSGSAVLDAALWLSAYPGAGETIDVVYTAPHDLTIVSGGTLTIPGDHEHVLVLFVVWKAAIHGAAQEQQSPTDGSSYLLMQYSETAMRAERSYRDALAALRPAQPGGRVRWRLDKWD